MSPIAGPVDFDLHGTVGIRLIDATVNDTAAVARQLGPIQKKLTYEPDIVIRFVDRLALASPITFIGVEDAGFTQDAFVVLRSKHKTPTRVQIPMDQIGQRCEIVCERGLPAVPLLIPIINLTALSKEALPLHAAGFVYQDVGALVTGWSKGGKTEALLAFMAQGARYIGDEWVYITDGGRCMHGIPEPVRVWRWHLQSMPQYRDYLPWRRRARLDGLQLIIKVLASAMERGLTPGSSSRRLLYLLRQQQHVNLPPSKLFDQKPGPLSASLDKIFFIASRETNDISVQPMAAEEVTERMLFSLQEEQQRFLSYYLKYRFAFPDARNRLVEEVADRQREALSRLLADKEAYAVYHPYPFSLPALFEVMQPYLT